MSKRLFLTNSLNRVYIESRNLKSKKGGIMLQSLVGLIFIILAGAVYLRFGYLLSIYLFDIYMGFLDASYSELEGISPDLFESEHKISKKIQIFTFKWGWPIRFLIMSPIVKSYLADVWSDDLMKLLYNFSPMGSLFAMKSPFVGRNWYICFMTIFWPLKIIWSLFILLVYCLLKIVDFVTYSTIFVFRIFVN